MRELTISQELLDAPMAEAARYRIVKEERVRFTKELAARLIMLPEFEGERNLNEKWVENLLTVAKAGSFLTSQVTLSTCHCKWDQRERRTNGQHCCWLRSYMPDDWSPLVNYVEYEAETEEDFRALYTWIDQNKTRTAGHKLDCLLLGSPLYREFSPYVRKSLGTALRCWLHGACHGEDTTQELYEKLTTNFAKSAVETAKYMSELKRQSEGYLMRGPVFGAMLGTFGVSREASVQFWDVVSDPTQAESRNDARNMLAKFLLATCVSHGRGGGYQNSVRSEIMVNTCVYAWNKWRSHEEILQLKPQQNRPKIK